ncbi:MAG: hypothetical protein DYG86_18335 [Chloroflexi bacterium CFX2]|nr:hypothetical protein [Chloroflexi bacterium CFX2]
MKSKRSDMTLDIYLPQDRIQAIANGASLPDRSSGTVMFADISGFTALTESLRETLGSRKGAEELTKRLDDAFTALIASLERYSGSVIGFAGDAITCWYDGEDGAVRAIHAGIEMQKAITDFPDLFLKVSIASGEARRFVVGDPSIQLIDVLAGRTVSRSALGERLAGKGQVLVDEATVQTLGASLEVDEWQLVDGEKFAVIKNMEQKAGEQKTTLKSLDPSSLNQWALPHLQGRQDFFSEFRPCLAMFIRFSGIDFEGDNAQSLLDVFVKEMQKSAARYDGVLLQVTIGDKGSYAYINFGAVNAHEDNPQRALKAALELRNKTELHLQIGITQGLMLVGAYGGETRKTFGALGDDVNLAAK